MLFLFAENRGHPLDPGMISAELGVAAGCTYGFY